MFVLVRVFRYSVFCSGLDLCIGRWDNCGHPLTDLEPLHLTTENIDPEAGFKAVSEAMWNEGQGLSLLRISVC